jgi:charged multivesicular body protein 4
LKETLDLLEKRQAFLQKKIEQQNAEAKKYMQQKNKRAALAALKRRKAYEAQCEKINGAMTTIETQVMTLENANVSMQAIGAMQEGAKAMKGIHKEMNIDQVEDTMDEIREQMDIANEISDAISQPLGGEVYDDDELLAELDELEQEGLDEQLLNANTAPPVKLPNAPSKTPQKATANEEEELEKLAASMI